MFVQTGHIIGSLYYILPGYLQKKSHEAVSIASNQNKYVLLGIQTFLFTNNVCVLVPGHYLHSQKNIHCYLSSLTTLILWISEADDIHNACPFPDTLNDKSTLEEHINIIIGYT